MDQSKLITIIGSVLSFGIALLQMYVTLRLLKYKEIVKKEILEEVGKMHMELVRDLGKLEAESVRKDVLQEKLKNIEHQITIISGGGSRRRNT